MLLGQHFTCSWFHLHAHTLYCCPVLKTDICATHNGIPCLARVLVQGTVLLPASGEGSEGRAAGHSSRSSRYSSSIGVSTKQQVRWPPSSTVFCVNTACCACPLSATDFGGKGTDLQGAKPQQHARTGDILQHIAGMLAHIVTVIVAKQHVQQLHVILAPIALMQEHFH